MPWCPKCKNEYREGITVCTDCGCALVEEEQFDNQTSLIFGEEEQMTSLKKFLEFNKIEGVSLQYDEQEEVYEVLVREQDMKKASRITRIFLEQENARKLKEKNASEGEESEHTALKEMISQGTILEKTVSEEKNPDNEELLQRAADELSSGVYKNSADRAEDNKSSAWTLLLVGSVGLLAMILGIVGVLPFSIGNPYMFYGVMSTVFLLFIIMGVVSMKNAKIFAKKAESENTLRETLMKWCEESLNADAIDAELGVANGRNEADNEEIAEEVLYFKRYEKLKAKLNHQFMNLDQSFLENFIDEFVYDTVFGK